MRQFVRSKLVLVAAGTFLALSAAIGALAAPDITPWPDPDPSAKQAGLEGEPTATETQTPEATETLEPTETPEAEATAQADGDLGVPLDSPACAGDLEDPNPHDTDGDGDGCRIVETEDGPKNLPDPAADAQGGNPGHIGDLHRPEHSLTPGPPEGVPPGPPENVPHGPPEGVGPPAGN